MVQLHLPDYLIKCWHIANFSIQHPTIIPQAQQKRQPKLPSAVLMETPYKPPNIASSNVCGSARAAAADEVRKGC